MVGKLDALEDVLKKREADIKAIEDANDDEQARAAKATEEAQRHAAEIAKDFLILYKMILQYNVVKTKNHSMYCIIL